MSRARRPSDHARVCRTETHMQQPTTPHNQGSQGLMMRKPVSSYRPPVGVHAHRQPTFFLGSNKTTGLMVTQHDIRFLVALGTLVVAYWLIFLFPSYIVARMHVLIDGCFWNTPPSPLSHFSPSSSHYISPRRTLSIPTTSHIH